MGAYRTSSADGTDGARSGTPIGASSAASFTCCNRVRVGAIVRVNTGLTRPSTIASIVGAKRGRWCAIFEALAKLGKDSVALSLDSTSIKAHRCASGGKGGEHNQAIGR